MNLKFDRWYSTTICTFYYTWDLLESTDPLFVIFRYLDP